MSNHDYVIDNAVGATVRADINSALAAIVTNNSSATEPATMYAYQLWFDTSVGYMKQRNSANTAWVALSVAPATAAEHAARLDQISLMPTVASAATIDVFGAAGATINLTGTTTVTGLTACAAAQVGSKKTIIPSNAAGVSFTASASMSVDGATSGTFLMPQSAIMEVLATSTTTFNVRTVFAQINFTPAYELETPGTSSFGTYSVQTGKAVKIGNKVSAYIVIVGGTFSLGTGSGNLYITNLPWASKSNGANLSLTYATGYTTLVPTHSSVELSGTRVALYSAASATYTQLTSANCGSSLRTHLSGDYLAS